MKCLNSTLSCDRERLSSRLRYRKAKVYARANIPECWLVDANQQQIFVFRNPQKDTYQVKQVFEVKDAIAPVTFPDVVIELAKFL